MMRRLVLSLAVAVIAMLPNGFGNVQVPQTGGALQAGPVGSSLEDNELSIALPIRNVGKAPVGGARISKIVVDNVPATTKLPMELGAIAPGESQTIFATFEKGRFSAGGSYAITINGTYRAGRQDYRLDLTAKFRIPPKSPGEAKASTSSSDPKEVKGARYPARRPSFDREINEGTIWTVPMGKERRNEPAPETKSERASKEQKNVGSPGTELEFAL